MITTKCLNINYNNVSQKRLAKFTLIKYHINFQNYGNDVHVCTVDINITKSFSEHVSIIVQ